MAEDMTEIYGVAVPGSCYMGEGASAKMYNHPLSTEEIIEQIQKGVEPKSLIASNFTRKAEFAKLAFWLRSYGNDEDMARFIEAIALKKNFARDYRVQMHLLKMMIKLFKAAEQMIKPYIRANETVQEYADRWKVLTKEVDIIRTEINRLLHTTYRGIKRKYPHGGTPNDRSSPESG